MSPSLTLSLTNVSPPPSLLIAQLGVFFAPDCNVSAIASEVVARDANNNSGGDSSSSSSVDGGGASHSERFVLRVDDAVRRIDRVITEHIGANHGTLLRHAGSADELQRRVTDVQASVRALQLAAGDLEAVVAAQHRKLQAGLRKHRNVDKCADILRRLLRFHQLSERVLGSSLSVVTGPSTARSRAASSEHALLAAAGSSSEVASELAALALAIREIEALVVDPQFEDLSVVRMCLPSVRRVGANIRRDVRASLRAGMQRLSQADVGDALQILFYLGNLSESVQTTVNDVIQDVECKCSAAIAEEKLASSSAVGSSVAQPNGGAHEAAAQKADAWKAIQEVFEVLRVHALQVWNLQRVLVKMQDASAGKNYLELVIERDEPTLFATFWEVSCAIVRELFASTLGYKTAVKLVLVSSYPRMREEANRVLNELFAATHQHKTDAELLSDALAATSVTANAGRRDALQGIASSAAERSQLLDSMAPLLDAFTDRTYRRLANPIQLMFPQSSNFHTSPPGRSDMQTLARTIFSEVDQAGQDPVLLDGALQQIRKAVTLFCTNVKRIMNTGKAATATSPTFGRTPAQAHNVSLLNVLHQLEEALSDVVTRVTTAAAAAPSNHPAMSPIDESEVVTPKSLQALCTKEIQPCRELIQSLEYSILGTYLQSLCAILEGIFAKMHDESFADRRVPSGSASASTAVNSQSNGSRYMVEFNGAFHVVLEEHIKRLPNALFAGICVSDFVARLISVFIRHASLLRPLEENGKLRLADDMAQLELRLEHLMPLKTLGAPYEELRAFRHMVFLESSSVLRDATIDKVRPTNVWHHLISRAPVELQLPHQMKRWSAAKYVEWLDKSAGFEGRTSPSAKSAEALSATQLPLGYPCLKDRRTALHAEKEAWKEIGKCLDAYAQRVSASAASAAISPIYDILLESGGILLAGYEVSLSR